jgi:hypothetical protein
MKMDDLNGTYSLNIFIENFEIDFEFGNFVKTFTNRRVLK